MNISVFGTGYVGLVTGTCFADFGMNVTCVDTDAAKIEALQQGRIPIYEPNLEFLVQKNMREKRLSFSTDSERAIRTALVIIIAVGTPQDDSGAADLSAIKAVATAIGQNLDGYKVIATKSTVPAGTGHRIREIIQEHAGARAKFDVVSNPEFLREGSAIEDFLRPDRVVIGAESEQATAIMKDIYSPLYLIETPFVITDVESAEMIKYASNAFLATKVSFINEVAMLCEKVGADVHMVAKGMGLDKRIGPKFLHPGPGYGGSCFPKDTLAFADLARKHDHDMKIVQATIAANERQRSWAADKVLAALGKPDGALVAIAGLAFKPNTDDMRESPALDIVRALMAAGARVRAYDPAAMEHAKRMLPGLELADDLYALVDGADCLVFLTEWNQFRKADLAGIKARLKRPLIVDLRNIYEPQQMTDAGFEYHCVGRPVRRS
jgi:UDPglucose 6-dehydrogenase